jgi:hypothetical protein
LPRLVGLQKARELIMIDPIDAHIFAAESPLVGR